MLRYPIGQQDFPKIREENKVYVDKTALMYQLVNTYNYVFLSRPRRFGKSLLLSTIKAYFEGRKELFNGLAVENLEKDWEKHPVISIELSRLNAYDYDSLNKHLVYQFEAVEKKYGIEPYSTDLSLRFSNLIQSLFEKTGKRVVILIDEYDNPLINTLHDDQLHEKNRNILKSVYSNLKAMDECIRFAMLTGVSRFSKMTIFSGLNNLYDISFDKNFNTICGITEKELHSQLSMGVEKLAIDNNISSQEAFALLKRYYDGYHFTKDCPDIYNPFSLLCSLQKSELEPFWLETATPEFLVNKLKDINEDLSKVLNDKTNESALSASDTSFSSPVALLYQTGYLTIKSYDSSTNLYRLGIPNREVEEGFLPNLLGDFIGRDKFKAKDEAQYIKSALLEGNIEEFMENLQIFYSSIHYTTIPKVSEKYFQNVMYLTFRVMGLDIEAEKPNSFGRSDIILKTGKFIYIFELKLDKPAEKALEQIERKGYALPYLNSGKEVVCIGISFSSKTLNIEDTAIHKL